MLEEGEIIRQWEINSGGMMACQTNDTDTDTDTTASTTTNASNVRQNGTQGFNFNRMKTLLLVLADQKTIIGGLRFRVPTSHETFPGLVQ